MMFSERLPSAAYERAERMLGHHRSRLALRASVRPRWIGDGERFWYSVDTERGSEFVLVDSETGARRAAFNHERLAAALATAAGTEVMPYDLPFGEIDLAGEVVAFDAFGARWTYRPGDPACRRDEGR